MRGYKELNFTRDGFRKCSCSHTMRIRRDQGWLKCSHCGKLVFYDERAKFKFKAKDAIRKANIHG